jgi:nitroreductase
MTDTETPATSLIHPLIARRWSPRTFRPVPIEKEKLQALFEAARWTASCFNEQPWRFVVATQDRPKDFGRILSTLAPKNQEWARDAWLLGFTAGKRTFTHNSAANRFGLHDTGAALAVLMLEATSLDLYVHGMGGFDAEMARREFLVPEDFEIGAAFAVGAVEGNPEPPLSRNRKPLSELVFGHEWGRTSELIA